MLASSGAVRGIADEWSFEPKFDGWRCLVYVEDLRVRAVTRNGHDITAKVPEIAGMADATGGRSLVLDGELIAHDGSPGSFYRILGRMAHGRPRTVGQRLSFVAFDVLYRDGDVTAKPYTERRAMLEELDLTGAAWCTTPAYVGLGAELFAACTNLGLEGLVAKRLTSRYEQGKRSSAWVKAKCADWFTHHAEHRRAK